jgi:hypothetical protein
MKNSRLSGVVPDLLVILLVAVALAAAYHLRQKLQITDAVFGPLVGAAIAVVGVTIANLNSRRQLYAQLAHSKDMTRESREFEMRREVYLDAADAISRINHSFGAIADLSIPDAEITRTGADAFAHLAKVQLVGDITTVGAVMEFQGVAGRESLQLWPQRHALILRQKHMAYLMGLIDSQSADKDRWVEMMKQENLKAVRDEAQFQRITRQLEGAEDLRQRILVDWNNLRELQNVEHAAFAVECVTRGAVVQKSIPRVATLARNELHLQSDETTYAKQIEAQSVEGIEATKEAQKRLAALTASMTK